MKTSSTGHLMANALTGSLALLPLLAAGQSTISSTDRYAYAANAGWIDFRATEADGVRVTDTLLSGYAYAANFGWISFGNGSPASGYAYANSSTTDYGVNVAADGKLTGYAYAANAGWIQFEQTQGQPRVDLITGQFSGYAYSANLGWISLRNSSAGVTTQSIARPDSDGDGIPDGWEMQNFGNLTTANATSDKDKDGQSDLQEYTAGTNPNDAASRLRITAFSLNTALTQASMSFTTSPARKYHIESSATLLGVWSDSGIGTFNPDSGATTSKSFTAPGAPRRFYRPVAELPLP